MISYAKQKGIKLVSSTNGHLFKKTEESEKLISSGLNSIILALNGISQETYERYRQGGSLESVLQGIRTVVARKRGLFLGLWVSVQATFEVLSPMSERSPDQRVSRFAQ